MKSKFIFKAAAAFTMLTLILAGCSVAKKPLNPPAQNGTTQNGTQPGGTVTVPNTAGTGGQSLSAPGTTAAISDEQRASKISQQIVALGNIRRAPVVIDGTNAIVGVQLIDKNKPLANTTAVQTAQNRRNNITIPTDPTGVTTGPQTAAPGTSTTTNPSNIGANVGNAVNNVGQAIGTVPNNAGPTTNTIPSSEPVLTGNADMQTIIAQSVRNMDPTITKVYVTTDAGMIDRLQRLSTTLSREVTDITTKIQNGGGVR